MFASRKDKRPSLASLIHSALFVDSIWRPGDWKRIDELTPEERARGEAWRRWRDGPSPRRRTAQ
jgi:hypothetical protein